MQLIDSHAHLDFEDFHEDFTEVMSRAEKAGVFKIITIGVGVARSKKAILIAENYSHVYATIGVHPEELSEINLDTIHDELLRLAKTSHKVVAIGETGLDYYCGGKNLEGMGVHDKNGQKRLFEIQIDIAKHLALPLVIHIRNGKDEQAVNDAYEILKKSGYGNGVIHCFTLNADWAKRFVGLGFHIGFTGIITYKNTEEVKEAVTVLPLERVLVETDCPFLAPQKYRGKRNEPAYVAEVAEKIAEIKQIPVQEVADATTMNAEELFGI